MCSCTDVEPRYSLPQEPMALSCGPFVQKHVIQVVVLSVLFTVALLVYASKSSLFNVHIQIVTEGNYEEKPQQYGVTQPKYAVHKKVSHEENISSANNILILANTSHSSSGHDVSLGTTSYNIPESLLYKTKTFLPNFRNPCWYESSGKLKCLPYFFLAGMPKCGTTDLYYLLTKHPVIERSVKEPHWWTRKRFGYSKDVDVIEPLDKYITYFAKNTYRLQKYTITKTENSTKSVYHHHIVGDGSASTLWDMRYWLSQTNMDKNQPTFTTANIIKELLPNVKVIVILRNPVDRLYSDYLYFSKINKSPEDFHKRVESTVNQMNNCIFNYGRRLCAYKDVRVSETKKVRLNIGMYSVFLEDWFKVFPENQIMVIRLEDYTLHRPEYLQRLARFLEIEPYPEPLLTEIEDEAISNQRKKKDKKVGQMLPKTRDILEKFYQPFNEQLPDFLQYEKYNWR